MSWKNEMFFQNGEDGPQGLISEYLLEGENEGGQNHLGFHQANDEFNFSNMMNSCNDNMQAAATTVSSPTGGRICENLHQDWKGDCSSSEKERAAECSSGGSPPIIGLKLTISPSFLSLVESKLSSGNNGNGNNTNNNNNRLKRSRTHEGYSQSSSNSCSSSSSIAATAGGMDMMMMMMMPPPPAAAAADKSLKASNSPMTSLVIGQWQRFSIHEGDLTAKVYYLKRKIVWEILDCGAALKSKMEILWSEITALRMTTSTTSQHPPLLEIELGRPPLFYREANPQPRKHTIWHPSSDFTGGHATYWRKHSVTFSESSAAVFHRHFHKILQCDPRLAGLSRLAPFPTNEDQEQEPPYFDPNVMANYYAASSTPPPPSNDSSAARGPISQQQQPPPHDYYSTAGGRRPLESSPSSFTATNPPIILLPPPAADIPPSNYADDDDDVDTDTEMVNFEPTTTSFGTNEQACMMNFPTLMGDYNDSTHHQFMMNDVQDDDDDDINNAYNNNNPNYYKKHYSTMMMMMVSSSLTDIEQHLLGPDDDGGGGTTLLEAQVETMSSALLGAHHDDGGNTIIDHHYPPHQPQVVDAQNPTTAGNNNNNVPPQQQNYDLGLTSMGDNFIDSLQLDFSDLWD